MLGGTILSVKQLETVIEEDWQIKFLHEAKIALYKLVEELTMTSDTCGRANWI